MPTTRFLPGDRVQVKPPSAAVLGLNTNATYTIAHVDDFGQIAIRGGSSYYHPSHFELVERAVPDETYCLLDGEGDWWVFDTAANHWRCETHSGAFPRDQFEAGIRSIEYAFLGIDAEPLPAVAGVEVPEPEVDGRISAWYKIAEHPIFKDCYPEERPLIEAMTAKLDRIYSEGYEGTDVEFGEPELPTHDSLSRALAQMAEQLSIAGEAAGKAMGEFLRAVTDEREEDAA